MDLGYRLVGALFLICLASLALFQAGCGSSSNSTSTNNPLTMEGTWKVTASESGGSSGFTAGIVSQALQSGNCVVNTPLGIEFEVSGATTCFIADPNAGLGSINNVTGTWDYPPAGFLMGVGSADPIPANSTAQMVGYFVETDGTNVEVIDISGTITASTKTISGSFNCDTNSPVQCSYTGTFTATHQ